MTLCRSLLLLAAAAAAPAAAAAAQPPAVPVVPDPAGETFEDLDALERALREAEAEIELLGGLDAPPPGPRAGWPDLEPLAGLPPIRTVMHPGDRSVPVVTTLLRHTTILLPAEESIVDYVVGDAAYFDVRGADNVAYIKAMSDGRRTQVTLVTNFNRAYSFDVFSTADLRPDEVLTVRWPVERPAGSSALVPGFDPASFDISFAPAESLADYRERIGRAEADALGVAEEAAREEARVRELGLRRFDEYLSSYPRRIQFRYRLSEEIRSAPLLVTQMWTDGVFTYLRSRAQESPALYTLSGPDGDEPVLVNVDLRPDGLYVIDHVAAAGYAQLQGARGDWFVWDVPPLAMLAETPLPRGSAEPPWVRTRRSRPWVKRHPWLFGLLVGGGAGSVALLKVLR